MKTKIYVELLEEGSPTLKGVDAIHKGNNEYEILMPENYDPEDEVWEFVPGTIVRCERKKNFGEDILLAVEKI